jgi:tetratricopeptide (TPR) repeat protein
VQRKCWLFISGVVLAFSAGLAKAQEADRLGDGPARGVNLLELFESSQTANEFLQSLRAKAAQPRPQSAEGAKEKEAALATLGQAVSDYASNGPLTEPERLQLQREALSSFVSAADVALADGRIRYSDKVAELAYALRDRSVLESSFARLLQIRSDERYRYFALLDFGRALAKFGDNDQADGHFVEAIQTRPDLEDGFPARMVYAWHLRETARSREALKVLDEFGPANRQHHLSLALFRQALMHSLGADTTEVDKEMEEMRESLSTASGLGPIPKLSARTAFQPVNRIGLPVAAAQAPPPPWSHNNAADDSRTYILGDLWVPMITPLGVIYYSKMVVNSAEVVWNEAHTEPPTARYELAWAIRNRATQNMAPCGTYIGGEGGPVTSACRILTPDGPQPWAAATNKAWSCVIHGGTVYPGESQYQMVDVHQDIFTLWLYGYLDLVVDVVNGFVADPNPQNPFVAWPTSEQIWLQDPWDPSIWYPQLITVNNTWSGNPRGAQEWRGLNYCARQDPGYQDCKKPIGNVGGDFPYTVTTAATLPPVGGVCTASPPYQGDNFFWARGGG